VDALGREIGRRSVERLGGGLSRLVEESSALFRWSLTILVLLNGAAIYLTIAARDSLEPVMFQQLVLIFFIGVMMALLAALVGIALMLPVAGAMRRAVMHWTEVSISGVLSKSAMDSARRVRRASSLWLTVMGLITLCSLALFASGALMLGERFGIVGPPDETETVEIERGDADSETVESEASNETRAEIAPANSVVPVPVEKPAPTQTPQAPPKPAVKPAAPAQKPAPVAKAAPSKPAQSQPARVQQATSAPRPAPASPTPPPPSVVREPTPAPAPAPAPQPVPSAPILPE
jgi:hypothetical protein